VELLTIWVIVNNSTKINQNHFSPKLIEWWSTILPISTKITCHLNSLSDVNNFTNINKNHILGELLTITQWVKMRGDFYWYWWNYWPSLNELRWEVIFVDISGIVDHHSNKSPLTSTHWVMVNNSTNNNKNHLSLQLIEWWSIIPPISPQITSHFNSLSDSQQFHQYHLKSPLTSDYHSMSWSERWFVVILVELLTITQWVDVRGHCCWYWWNCWPSLNELKWEVIFVDICGIIDHHSMS
jgi:hypothetical protein